MTEPREALAALERIKTAAIENGGRLTPGAILDIQVAINAIAARSEGPGLDALREALNTCWMELEREHGHSSAWPDDTWPSCLLTHAALRAAHAALAAQENPS